MLRILLLLLLPIITSSNTQPPPPAAAAHPLRTTLIACKFKTFTILGCDSRTSIGGSYISNNSANKITLLTVPPLLKSLNAESSPPPVLIARCGSTLLTQSYLDILHSTCWKNYQSHSLRT